MKTLRHRLDRLAHRRPRQLPSDVLVIRRGARPDTESNSRSSQVDIVIRCLDHEGVPHEMFIPAIPDETYIPGEWWPVATCA